MRSLLQGFGCILAIGLMACSGGSNHGGTTPEPPASVAPVLSISAYYYTEPAPVSDQDLLQRYLEAYQLARAAGARGQFQSYTWQELEPHVGQYDSAKLADVAATLVNGADAGLTQLLGIQVINTVAREVPAELASTAWDDPAMVNALQQLFDQLMPALQNRVQYLSIGNEVDVYFFAGRTGEMAAYRNLFDAVRQHIKQQLPDTAVGITVTAGGWQSAQVQSLLDLQQNADALIMTYYPLNSDFTVQPPTAPAADFAALANLAGERPLVLQEVGYPSAALNNSSEAQQAEFIHQVFAAWRDQRNRIPFLNLFLLHDLDADLIDQFVLYYGVSDPRFRAYLDSLGLRNRDNTDKLAWPAVLDEMTNF